MILDNFFYKQFCTFLKNVQNFEIRIRKNLKVLENFLNIFAETQGLKDDISGENVLGTKKYQMLKNKKITLVSFPFPISQVTVRQGSIPSHQELHKFPDRCARADGPV